MIKDTILNRIVHSSGIEDASIVRLDVMAVYLLQGLSDACMFSHMCFKGGNSLRKIFARRPSRFSRDMDFVDASYQQLSDDGLSAEEYYYKLLETFDQKTMYDNYWRVKSLSDDEVHGDTLRVDLHFFLYGDRPEEEWERRSDNVLAVECSFRRPILLPPESRELREESWFKHLEFKPAAVPVLQVEESAAEKVRAAFQRNNPRDIYDLYQYGQLTFNESQIKTMTVLKCWQDRGMYNGPTNFEPAEFLGKLQIENYSWEKLKVQVADYAWIEPRELVKGLRERYSFLRELTEKETELCKDRWNKKRDLHDELWDGCKKAFEASKDR